MECPAVSPVAHTSERSLARLHVQHRDSPVIPAKAGIQGPCETCLTDDWMPACAGMTVAWVPAQVGKTVGHAAMTMGCAGGFPCCLGRLAPCLPTASAQLPYR